MPIIFIINQNLFSYPHFGYLHSFIISLEFIDGADKQGNYEILIIQNKIVQKYLIFIVLGAMTSMVWNHFTKLNASFAKCNECGESLRINNYGTSALINHAALHKINLKKRSSSQPDSSTGSSKDPKISKFLTRESRSMLLAKCAAKDKFPIARIISSDACKAYLASRNHQMPSSCATVWEEIRKYHAEVFESFQKFVFDSKVAGKKFSIIIDEWTDVSSKRYLNITLHNGLKSLQYCLASIGSGKCDAQKLKQIVSNKLQNIDLDLKADIVASINDGASVMKKYGTLMPFEQQLCLNHGINLAIMDVLYKQNIPECESESENSDSDIDDDESFSENQSIEIDEPAPLEMNYAYKSIIETVRKYVRIFRKSPMKLSQLKKNMLDTIGKDLTLLIDCKTRWNSVLPMLDRFNKIKSVIKSTMNEFNIFYDVEIDAKIPEIIECLLPVEECIKKLSSDSCDLLIAEATCVYLLSTLEKLNSTFGRDLYQAMKVRIAERRNVELISALMFLHSGDYPKDNKFFKYSTKAVIKKKIKDLFARLFCEFPEDEQQETSQKDSDLLSLNDSISKFMSTQPPRCGIDSDIKAFEATKERTEKLQKIYSALKTIQATSTSVERTFSVAGSFKTKVRSKMLEDKLNILVSLKYHFQSNH